VRVVDNAFEPEAILVSAGATVTWTWAGSDAHNVTFAQSAGIPASFTQVNGVYEADMPTTPGTYNYECTIHSGMDGAVTVQ
jgi:plastocyanin